MTYLIELTLPISLELLRGGEIGRVGLTTPVGPRVIPVTYKLFKDDIVFRTTPYSELGTYGPGRDVAFEVDQFDSGLREGWSVLAVGRLEVVDDPSVVRIIQESDDPQPWAGGRRNLYMRLAWRDLTGRRVRAPKAAAPGSA
jgi:hypothetical protein